MYPLSDISGIHGLDTYGTYEMSVWILCLTAYAKQSSPFLSLLFPSLMSWDLKCWVMQVHQCFYLLFLKQLRLANKNQIFTNKKRLNYFKLKKKLSLKTWLKQQLESRYATLRRNSLLALQFVWSLNSISTKYYTFWRRNSFSFSSNLDTFVLPFLLPYILEPGDRNSLRQWAEI